MSGVITINLDGGHPLEADPSSLQRQADIFQACVSSQSATDSVAAAAAQDEDDRFEEIFEYLWALHELCRDADVQRSETRCSRKDPATWSKKSKENQDKQDSNK